MELIYLRSPTGQQHERAKKVLDAIRSAMPELTIREVDPADDPDYAQRFKIKYAPGLIVDGRIEFVGIPREKMLLERLQLLAQATFRPSSAAAAPVTAPVGMSPEQKQRRIEEAKRRAEEAKRQQEAAGQAAGAPSTPPAPPSPGPATPPIMSPEERQRKIEEARKKAEEIRKQREASGGS